MPESLDEFGEHLETTALIHSHSPSQFAPPKPLPVPSPSHFQWFAKYAAFAKVNNLIDGGLFEPVMEMTRAGVAEVMFRILK